MSMKKNILVTASLAFAAAAGIRSADAAMLLPENSAYAKKMVEEHRRTAQYRKDFRIAAALPELNAAQVAPFARQARFSQSGLKYLESCRAQTPENDSIETQGADVISCMRTNLWADRLPGLLAGGAIGAGVAYLLKRRRRQQGLD